MHLSGVEQCVADAIEQAGDMIGEYLLQRRHFGAVVLEQMQPVIREVALVCGDWFNACAVMADATYPIGTES